MKGIRLCGAALMASTTLLGAGQVFAAVSQPNTPTPANAQTPVSAELTLEQTVTPPTPPIDPDQGGTDQGTGITGLFGIAYAPKALSGTAQLNENGETQVALSNTEAANAQNKYNVGVQDKTRAQDRNWSLKAQLVWDGANKDYMNGTSITATEGNVKINNGGTLSELANGEVTTTAASLSISSVETEIMTAQKGKTMNGVYNYQFKDPKLVIPNSENVTAGTYSGNIVWNLSNVTE